MRRARDARVHSNEDDGTRRACVVNVRGRPRTESRDASDDERDGVDVEDVEDDEDDEDEDDVEDDDEDDVSRAVGTVRRDDARGEDANDGGIVDDDDDDDVIASSARTRRPGGRRLARGRRRRLRGGGSGRGGEQTGTIDAQGGVASGVGRFRRERVVGGDLERDRFRDVFIGDVQRVQPRRVGRFVPGRHSVVHGHHLDGFVDVD